MQKINDFFAPLKKIRVRLSFFSCGNILKKGSIFQYNNNYKFCKLYNLDFGH